MPEPKLKEVSVSFRSGGKVGIVKYDLSSDYSVSLQKSWTIPDDWTNEQAEVFLAEQTKAVMGEVEVRSQAVVDGLMEQSEIFT